MFFRGPPASRPGYDSGVNLAFGILAGGRSSRMGRDKALLDFGGVPLVRRILDRLGGSALISANDERLATFGTVVRDVLPERCPLAGIHALLRASPAERMFICACDMPHVSRALADHLHSFEGDFVLPVSPEGDEPLHAVYSKSCLPAIERRAGEGRWKVTDFADLVRTTRIPIDPRDWLVDGRSPFSNVNSPADLI